VTASCGDPNRERETVEPVQECGGARASPGVSPKSGWMRRACSRKSTAAACSTAARSGAEIGQGQPRHRQPMLQAKVQRFAARDQHLERRRGSQQRRHPSRCGQEMLKVIQDQQKVAVPEGAGREPAVALRRLKKTI